MRCIFCLEERPPSQEHVFPRAIGGPLTIDRVCDQCNSELGTRVDAALCDFLPVRGRRAKLRLTGNSGVVPEWYELFLGDATLVGEAACRIQTTFDKDTGKLSHRRLHHAANVVLSSGRKVRQITVDARDKDHIPKIIRRERQRHNLRPLSEEELGAEANKYTERTVQAPLIMKSLQVSFAYAQHAVLKIVYELAFLWLGEAYLDDPMAAQLRVAVTSTDLDAVDPYAGNIFDAKDCAAFSNYWTPHESHHIAYSSVLPAKIVVSVRLFDLYAAVIVVSEEPARYFQSQADMGKLKFLAIDTVSNKMIHTEFAEERHRLAMMMTAERRKPPFADPL
jgi:HNH endonuclease